MKFGHVWIYVEKLKKKLESYMKFWLIYKNEPQKSAFKEDRINHAKDMCI